MDRPFRAEDPALQNTQFNILLYPPNQPGATVLFRTAPARPPTHRMIRGDRGPCSLPRQFIWEGTIIATFTNQATLSYSGGVTNSNVVTGEITDSMSATKTPISASYTPGETVTYVISIVNDGDTAVTGLTVTDDFGGYDFEGETVYPLEYVEGSLLYLVDGEIQPTPDGTAGPPGVVTGIEVPADGNATLIYEARVTRFAPLGADAQITNTAVIEGGCAPLSVTATLPMAGEAQLTISKSVSPEVVPACGALTYTFVIQNAGSEAADAEDLVAVTDTFNPTLTGLTAELDGVALTATTDYTYDEDTGLFATVPGRIVVPGATFTQNADGSWAVTPGVTVLTVTGTL